MAQDADAAKVSAKAEKTTIEWIQGVRRPADMPSAKPGDYENKRARPFETTLWTVEGTLTSYKLLPDGALWMQIDNENGKSIQVEVPNVGGEKTRFTKAITSTRRQLITTLSPTAKKESALLKIRVTGFGFFAPEKGDDGKVTNGAWLAPLVSAETWKE